MPINKVIGIVVCCLLMSNAPVFAETDDVFQQQGENWLQLADQIVVYVDKAKYPEAREQLHILSKQFASSDLSSKKLSIEGVQILADELVQMERQLGRVVMSDPAAVREASIRLELSFDAVIHPNQPLWKQYYQSLKQKVTAFKQAEAKKDQSKMQQAKTELIQEYRLIRSALVISKKPETITKLDSLIQFLDKQTSPDLQKIGVSRFEEVLEPLFFGSEKEVLAAYRPYVDSGITLIIVWIGFWISVVFVYVGWRKAKMRRVTAHSS